MIRVTPINAKTQTDLSEILSRFESFVYVYVLHVIGSFFISIAVIADNAQVLNQELVNLAIIGLMLTSGTRYASIIKENPTAMVIDNHNPEQVLQIQPKVGVSDDRNNSIHIGDISYSTKNDTPFYSSQNATSGVNSSNGTIGMNTIDVD
eukprot:Awhi_evm1s4254